MHVKYGSGSDPTPTRYEYLWEDGVKYRRPTKLTAPDYVDTLMNWAQNILDDEAIFPNKIGSSPFSFPPHPSSSVYLLGVPFPRNFRDTVRTIIRRLFRVYAHIYSNHFEHICALGIERA
jgi:MOB kinase activator 1